MSRSRRALAGTPTQTMARWTQARCKATYRAALAWPAAGTFALAGPSSFPMPSLVCALAGTSSVPMPSLMTRPSLVILGETRSTFAPAAQQPAAPLQQTKARKQNDTGRSSQGSSLGGHNRSRCGRVRPRVVGERASSIQRAHFCRLEPAARPHQGPPLHLPKGKQARESRAVAQTARGASRYLSVR